MFWMIYKDFWLVKKWKFQVSSPNRRDLDWQLSKWFPFHGFYESSRPALFSNDGSHSRQKARVPHEHGGEKKHAVLLWWVCSHIMVSVIWPEACLDDRYCLHGYILLWWLAVESIMQDLSISFHCLLLEFGMLLKQHLIDNLSTRKITSWFLMLSVPPFCMSAPGHFGAHKFALSPSATGGIMGWRDPGTPLHTLSVLSILQLFVTSNYPLHCPWFQVVCCWNQVHLQVSCIIPSLIRYMSYMSYLIGLKGRYSNCYNSARPQGQELPSLRRSLLLLGRF